MHKEGLDTSEWNIVKKLNENVNAKLHAKYGETRALNIKDSIRQGVLIVAQYAQLMVYTNKEIRKQSLGTNIPDLENTIGFPASDGRRSLITSNPKEVTDFIAGRYHINWLKSTVKTGGETKTEFQLWEMSLEYCPIYKIWAISSTTKHVRSYQSPERKCRGGIPSSISNHGNMSFENFEIKIIWE